MKKLLLIALSLMCWGYSAKCQCTPDNGITQPGIYPDTITNLPVAYKNNLYGTTMQVKVFTDTVVPGLGNVVITNIQILSVTGMPAGLNYQCYQNNCTFPGGSNRCVQISGTPTVPGVYPIVVNIKVNGVYGGFIPVSQNGTVTGYTIVVLDAPVANFNATPTTVCPGEAITFNDASTNNAASWSWTFTGGTPSSSTLQNPTVTYSAGGTYSVSMNATNPAGTGTVTKTNYVTVKNAPTGNIQLLSNDSVCRGDTIKLLASSPGSTLQWYRGQNILPGETGASLNTIQGGYYRIIASGTNGCTKSIGPKITKVINLPTAVITANGPTTFCPGSSVVLSANTDPGISYQWKRFTSDIANATQPSYTASQSGVYKVITRNTFGCARTSNTITVTASCREGLMATGSAMQVSPNPASAYTICEMIPQTNKLSIAIYSITGSKVYEQTTTVVADEAQAVSINIQSLQTGMYMLQVTDGEKIYTKRLTIE